MLYAFYTYTSMDIYIEVMYLCAYIYCMHTHVKIHKVYLVVNKHICTLTYITFSAYINGLIYIRIYTYIILYLYT